MSPFAVNMPSLRAASGHGHARWPNLPGIAVPDVITRIGDDPDFYGRLLARYLADAAASLADCERLVLDSRFAEASAALHKLKGEAANLGARALSRDLGAADARARERDLKPASVAELRSAADELLRLLQDWAHGGSAPAALAMASAPGIDAAALADFKSLLAQRRFAAVHAFQALEPALQGALDAASFKALQTAMAQMNFRLAAEHVARL